MFFILASLCASKNPLYYIPGLAQSNLFAIVDDSRLYEKCEITSNAQTLIWPSSNKECAAQLLDTIYDSENHFISHPPGVKITSQKITDGPPSNVNILNGLEDSYDIYSVYYNWVHYYIGNQDNFLDLKAHIESTVSATNYSEKAVLIGYSLGGHFIRYFLHHIVDEEWISKHIESAIYIAPALGGSFLSVVSAATGDVSFFSLFNQTFVKHAPVLYSLFPNFNNNKDVYIKEDGSKIPASEIFGLLKFYNLTDETMEGIYNLTLETLQEPIPDPGVNSAIIYNSGLSAVTGAKFSNGKNELVKGPGDGAIQIPEILYACDNWSSVKCFDVKSELHHNNFIIAEEVSIIIHDFLQVNVPSPTNKKIDNKTLALLIGLSVGVVIAVVISAFLILWIIRKAKSYGVDLEENLMDDVNQNIN